MTRRSACSALLAAGLLAGCGSWSRVGSNSEVKPSETLTQFLNLPAYYRRVGRLAATDPMPFVGSVTSAAGPGDTTIAILALSLENRAFSFQKEGNSFAARYHDGHVAIVEGVGYPNPDLSHFASLAYW